MWFFKFTPAVALDFITYNYSIVLYAVEMEYSEHAIISNH